ncbi:hypothetical protein GCK32_003098, partial [Trichostrongylus colubriformis]
MSEEELEDLLQQARDSAIPSAKSVPPVSTGLDTSSPSIPSHFTPPISTDMGIDSVDSSPFAATALYGTAPSTTEPNFKKTGLERQYDFNGEIINILWPIVEIMEGSRTILQRLSLTTFSEVADPADTTTPPSIHSSLRQLALHVLPFSEHRPGAALIKQFEDTSEKRWNNDLSHVLPKVYERYLFIQTIQVIGNKFLTDPCAMDHLCDPVDYATEKGNRHVYKEMQRIRRDPVCGEKKPVKVYLDMVAASLEADN